MASPRVLVVDSDPSALGLLTHGMNRLGLATDAARDSEQAISFLSTHRPDVVVSNVNSGGGLKVLETLRSRAETKDIPVLLLAKGPWARRRTQARELGAQELVSKPAFVQDIAVLTWLYAGKSASEQWFEGTFGEPSCGALMRGLLAGGRTGTLRLAPSDAIVRFQNGAIVDAVLPPLTGERALYRILALEAGSYELTFGPFSAVASMQFSLNDLQSRGFTHVKTWEKLRAELSPLEQILTVDFEQLTGRVASLPKGLFSLIRLFDGRRSVSDVIAASALDDVTAGQAIVKLRELGVFEQTKRPFWEDKTPTLDRVPQIEALAPTADDTELPPLAGDDLVGPLRLTAEMAMAPVATTVSVENDFFESPIEHVAPVVQEGRGRTTFAAALVGVCLAAVVVLLWRSTPNGSPVAAPVEAPPAPAVVVAPKVEAPVAPTPNVISEVAQRFDRLMSEGSIAYDKHDFKAALGKFQSARELQPNESSGAMAVGSTQYELGNLDAATEALSKAATLDPSNGRALVLLGAIAEERGQKDLARDYYQNYLSLDPDGEHAVDVKKLLANLGS